MAAVAGAFCAGAVAAGSESVPGADALVQPAANPPGFMGPSTRARMFGFLIGHTWDIYGQLVVYARLNDVTPPASQRP